jgi:hypothetical protein
MNAPTPDFERNLRGRDVEHTREARREHDLIKSGDRASDGHGHACLVRELCRGR